MKQHKQTNILNEVVLVISISRGGKMVRDDTSNHYLINSVYDKIFFMMMLLIKIVFLPINIINIILAYLLL